MLKCYNFQMVTVAKSQVREIASLMEGALMRNEHVVHKVINIDNDGENNVVQVLILRELEFDHLIIDHSKSII